MNDYHPIPATGQAAPPPIIAQTLAPDLLRGAEEISEFLFGTRGQRRKVYHLAETSKLPLFRLGSLLCARRSVLMNWIASQERQGM